MESDHHTNAHTNERGNPTPSNQFHWVFFNTLILSLPLEKKKKKKKKKKMMMMMMKRMKMMTKKKMAMKIMAM